MKTELAPRRLDVKAFAKTAGALAGEDPLAGYARLMAETEGRAASQSLRWAARGELRNPGHVNPDIWLHLEASATLALTCQRCLGPVDVPVTVSRSYRFVADEALAAAQDDDSEEDVLALSPAFDLAELLEDEFLMELPLAPRHEACPEPVTLAVADPDFEEALARREKPFAQLGKLRTGKG